MKREVKNPNRLSFQRKTPVKDYITAKDERDNRLWKRVGNRWLTFFKGEWISLTEFEAHFPILSQPCLLSNPFNKNRRKNWSI